jgi:asparagine synthase (glutamine-hydrolysing)
MGVSLETRIPLLDHRVVELAWRLPLSMKIRGGTSKWVLREVLFKHVPRKLIERPKKGFSIPIGQWLRGPLRAWAESLIARDRMEKQGVLEVAAVHKAWHEHLSGERNWERKLWTVLMFQVWMAEHCTTNRPEW